MLPKTFQNYLQNLEETIENPTQFFHRIFDPIFHRLLLVFAVARPTISLVFTALSWGATFFAKFLKY